MHNLLACFNGATIHQAVLEVATSKSNKHTGLQHEHLGPLDAISQSNALDSQSHAIDLQSRKHKWVRGLPSHEAKHYHGKHIPKVLNILQVLDTLLLIEGGRKLAVTPFSRALTALSDCPLCIPGLSVIQKTSHWCVTDSPWGPDGLSEVKGRTVRHLRTDRPTPGRSKTRLCLKQ
jgi:hypothetical protein